jgi:hypothetical protein
VAYIPNQPTAGKVIYQIPLRRGRKLILPRKKCNKKSRWKRIDSVLSAYNL